jgi:hypothetical protein
MFLEDSAKSSHTALLYLHVFTFFVGKEDGLGTYKPYSQALGEFCIKRLRTYFD